MRRAGLDDPLGQRVVVAHQPGDRPQPSATTTAAGQRGHVDDRVAALAPGVGDAVAEHHPALGVGVVDLDRRPVQRGDDVAGLDRPGPGMFSVAPTTPSTRTGAPSSASAPIASITAAPPHMSNFISIIRAAGFRARPPVSNVTALPTSASRGGPATPAPS